MKNCIDHSGWSLIFFKVKAIWISLPKCLLDTVALVSAKQTMSTNLFVHTTFSKLIAWNFMSPSSLITFNGVCVWRITWYQPVTSNSCLHTVVSNGTPTGWPGGPCLPLENCWPPPVSHREAPPLLNHIQFIQSIFSQDINAKTI